MSEQLTPMQSFFLDVIQKSDEELNPSYLASLWYQSIGKRRNSDSRRSFGQTSAAYRTCRKLVELNLVKEHHYKSEGGYSYTKYSQIKTTNQ